MNHLSQECVAFNSLNRLSVHLLILVLDELYVHRQVLFSRR